MAHAPHDSPQHDPRGDERPSDVSWPAPRVWGIGEDPLAWTVPLLSVRTFRLRVHVLLILWMGAEMVAWVPRGAVGLVHVFAAVVSIFGVLVVRESARELIRRFTGGESQPVVLWPLGGLGVTPAGPVPRPFLAETGGLLTGALLVPVLGYAVIASGAGWQALMLDLLSPGVTAGGLRSHWQIWAWWAYYANAVVLVANALLPMLPMDSGRLVRTLAAQHSESASRKAVRMAMFTSLAVFVFGACMGELRILAVGVLGAFTSYMDLRRSEFLASSPEQPDVETDAGAAGETEAIPEGDGEEPPMEDATPVDLDAVLRQISARGLESLSPEQREVLRRETDRRRRR